MEVTKLMSKFLAWIISAQLILGALPHSPVKMVAWAETCPAGLQFNSILGRCLSTEQASRVAQASQQCESQSTVAAKRQCYYAAAEGQLKDAETSGKVSAAGKIKGNTLSTILVLAGLTSSVAFLAMKGGSCPGATSAYLIAGGSVAVLAGEILASKTYKNKMKKAQQKLKGINDSSKGTTSSNGASSEVVNATNVQVEAFDALIAQEEAVISAAKTKKKLYMLATAAYAAATVMAALELFRASTGAGAATTTCSTSGSSDESIRNTESQLNLCEPGQSNCITSTRGPQGRSLDRYVDNYFQYKQRIDYRHYEFDSRIFQTRNLSELQAVSLEAEMMDAGSQSSLDIHSYSRLNQQIKAADMSVTKEDMSLLQMATVVAKQVIIPRAEAGLIPASATNGFVRLYSRPETRTALAGVLTTHNVFMIGKINSEKSKAEERKKFLEELRDQLMASGNAFSCASADRSNPGNPNCYCYGTDGKINPARNNSQVCAALFQNKNLASTSYTTGSGEAIPNFCTNSSGALDEGCSCRASNSCLTIGGLSGSLGGSGINLGSIPSTLNSVNNGSLNGANLDEGSLTSQATRLSEIGKQIETKNPQIAKANRDARQQAEAILKSTSGGLPAGGSLGSSSNGFDEALLAAQTPEQALSAIKQEIGRVEAAAAASNVTGTRSEEGLDLSGLGASSPVGGVTLDEGQLAAAVENNLANGNSDINTSNGTLFQILSNRFQRSGMRRLFGEPGLPAERPNESDISK